MSVFHPHVVQEIANTLCYVIKQLQTDRQRKKVLFKKKSSTANAEYCSVIKVLQSEYDWEFLCFPRLTVWSSHH